MQYLKFSIIYKDRVGLLLDISGVLTRKNYNVINLEVVPDIMYMEIESLEDIDRDLLFQELQGIYGVAKCEAVEALPWEETNKRLVAVLDSISEGVVAINAKGEITTVNPVMEQIFKMAKEDLIGKSIIEILDEDIPMLSCLQTGEPYSHHEISINKGQIKYHYLTSGRPIKDKHGQVMGVVATVKDMTEVRQLVYSVTRPAMVTFNEIVGGSIRLRTVMQLGKKIAAGDSIVLLRGESGTGKELFARAIHMESSRRNQPFVPINCAALPDSLLESELFGYTEGAFTGACKKGKQGLFEFAQDGTIFLDEIGNISPNLQAKLLRVIQEGKVRRVGGQEEIPVNVRVIAATNKPLEDLVARGEFREDLYYRLNVIPIFLPPLRDRKEDIPFLVNHFLSKMNIRLRKNVKSIDSEALEKLMAYDWPGNVRELENAIERAVNLVSGTRIGAEHILINHRERQLSNDTILGHYDQGDVLADIVGIVEKQVIAQALHKSGSIRKAAKSLGVSHTTIMNKIKRYQIGTGKI